MKSSIAIFTVALLAAVPAMASPVVLDVKTHIKEVALQPLTLATQYYLAQSGSYVILDIGEDYACWISEYTAERDGQKVDVSVKITITPPSAFFEKKALATRVVKFSYAAQGPDTLTTDDSATRFLRKKLTTLAGEKLIEAKTGGPIIAQVISDAVKSLGK